MKEDSVQISDKTEMLGCFNEHFIASGWLFTSQNIAQGATDHSDGCIWEGEPFNFIPVTVSEVHKALKSLEPRKSAGPDNLEPYFLKLAADFIALPMAYLFNLSLETNEIPLIWKSAFVLPLLKGGDPTLLNNYRPISK